MEVNQQDEIRLLQVEYSTLQKKLRASEIEWNNDKAFLQQKVEIQQIQINEGKSREDHLKRLNDTFMNSLQDPPERSNTVNQSRHYKELQKSIESNNRDMVESKSKLQEHIGRQDCKIRELEDVIHERELQIKDIEKLKDRQIMQLENQLIETQAKDALGEQKIQKLLADAKQYWGAFHHYSQDISSAILKDLNQTMQQVKADHKKELEKQRTSNELEIKKLKQQSMVVRKSISDENKSPLSKQSYQKVVDEVEFKYRDEKKKLKQSLISCECTIRTLKEKNDSLRQFIYNYQSNYDEVRYQVVNLQKEIQQLISLNNQLSSQVSQMNQQEEVMKCEIVHLSTQVEESKIHYDRLQSNVEQRNRQEIAQSPHPTTRIQTVHPNNSYSILTNPKQIRQKEEYIQLSLNHLGKQTTKESVKQIITSNVPNVTQFSTYNNNNKNSSSFKVMDLIQHTQLQGYQQEIQSNSLVDQMSKMIGKLKEAKKKVKNTSFQESSFIRQEIHQIHLRSRNNSISMNYEDTNILKDLDDSRLPQEEYMEPKRVMNNVPSSILNISADDSFKPKYVKQPQMSQRSRYGAGSVDNKILQIEKNYHP